jgi:hypothetical protein
MYSQTIVSLRLKPYNRTYPLLKCLNRYLHHINRPLYVTTTYLLLLLLFVFHELYTNTLCFAYQLNQDALYNSVMHDDQGIKGVLPQILEKMHAH